MRKLEIFSIHVNRYGIIRLAYESFGVPQTKRENVRHYRRILTFTLQIYTHKSKVLRERFFIVARNFGDFFINLARVIS